jgi:predicted site-specific integrase-resolvase
MSCLIEPLLDSSKVARLLGVEVATLAAWRRRGYGPRWYRIGKQVKYAEADLRGWMDAQAGPDISSVQTTPPGVHQ